MSNKVTQEEISVLMAEAKYEEYVFYDKSLVVAAKLPSGFVIVGVGSCVDPREFNKEIGRRVAKAQIESKLWELEGYVLQNVTQKNLDA